MYIYMERRTIKPARKMGHINIVGDDVKLLKDKLEIVNCKTLKILKMDNETPLVESSSGSDSDHYLDADATARRAESFGLNMKLWLSLPIEQSLAFSLFKKEQQVKA